MIRTCDPLIRSQVLYPAELRVHKRRIARLQSIRWCVKREATGAGRLLGEIALACSRYQLRIFYVDLDRTPFAIAFVVG